jgi:hypothetical protein
LLGKFHLLKALSYAFGLMVQSLRTMPIIHVLILAISVIIGFYPLPEAHKELVRPILWGLWGFSIYLGVSALIYQSSYGVKKSGLSSISLGLFDAKLIIAIILSLSMVILGLFGLLSVYVVITSLFTLGNDPLALFKAVFADPMAPQSILSIIALGLMLIVMLRLLLSLMPTPFLVAEKGLLAPLASFGYVTSKISKLCLSIALCVMPTALCIWISSRSILSLNPIGCLLVLVSVWVSCLLITGVMGSLVKQARSLA